MSYTQSLSDGTYYCDDCGEGYGECVCVSQEESEAQRDEESDRKRDMERGL